MLSVAGICSTREGRGIFQTNSLDCNKRGDLFSVAGICSTREERGIFQANSLDYNKRGDLTFLNLSQSNAKQNGKKPTTLPFVPDNPDGRISELLFDTTVVQPPLPGPNSKQKLTLIEA